jgi:hypothetical protein
MTTTVDSPVPDHIGRYRILGRLGSGGMGTVYRAHDPHLDRVVALKVPTLDGPAEQQAARVQRFQREARAAARILHPNVCPIFDVGEHEGAAFVVMAFVDGRSLGEELARRGPLPISEAVGLVRQLLDALAAVHAHGIVHRDVKPSNILLDAAGRIILTDFGLARPEETGDGLTSEGAVVGTPAYMAPEQAAGQAAQIGPWTDLYAVGVVLYQMLTGRLPFEGPAAAILGAVVRDEPPAPRQFRRDLPAALEAIVLKVLRKAPQERFLLAADFDASLAGMAGAVTRDRSQTLELRADRPVERPAAPVAEDWRSWLMRRLRRLPGAALVAGGSAVLAYLVMYFFSTQYEKGRLLPVIFAPPFSAIPLVLLGAGWWSLVELCWAPEGVLHAARHGWTWCIRAAVHNGVPLGVADDMGETPLMHAAAGGHTEVVKVLLLQGVDTTAVSSLRQTAIEIAYARGHAPIVALLQKETRPPPPPTTLARRPPSARRWLVVSALVGAAFVVWFNWVNDPWPTRIEFDVVWALVNNNEVKQIQTNNFIVRGEVKFPAQHGELAQGCFWAVLPSENRSLPLHRNPPLNYIQASTHPPPPGWSILLIVGIPLLVALLVSWPLGAAHWYPLLRPRQTDLRQRPGGLLSTEDRHRAYRVQ